MEEVLDVFGVVEGGEMCRALACFSFIPRLSRIYAYSDNFLVAVVFLRQVDGLPLKMHSRRKSGRDI